MTPFLTWNSYTVVPCFICSVCGFLSVVSDTFVPFCSKRQAGRRLMLSCAQDIHGSRDRRMSVKRLIFFIVV